MSEEEFSCVLNCLEGKTKYVYYHLMGEPLTHPLLPVFLKMAAERGFKSIITTNGTLLEKRGAELISAGIHKVNISVHSLEDGDAEKCERYLREVADFADEASQRGVIISLRLWNNGVDGGLNDRVLQFLQERFLDGEWQKNTRGVRIRDKLHLEWGERFEWPDSEARIYGDEVFCYGLKDHFGILCDGSVVPCCLDSDGVITLGNIFNGDIDAILSSERAQAMVEGFRCRKASEELCKRCQYATRF